MASLLTPGAFGGADTGPPSILAPSQSAPSILAPSQKAQPPSILNQGPPSILAPAPTGPSKPPAAKSAQKKKKPQKAKQPDPERTTVPVGDAVAPEPAMARKDKKEKQQKKKKPAPKKEPKASPEERRAEGGGRAELAAALRLLRVPDLARAEFAAEAVVQLRQEEDVDKAPGGRRPPVVGATEDTFLGARARRFRCKACHAERPRFAPPAGRRRRPLPFSRTPPT